MTALQLVVLVTAGAALVLLAVAITIIAVESTLRPRYARTRRGLELRGPSAPRAMPQPSPGPDVLVTAPCGGPAAEPGSGPQALRDAVDDRSARGVEVLD